MRTPRFKKLILTIVALVIFSLCIRSFAYLIRGYVQRKQLRVFQNTIAATLEPLRENFNGVHTIYMKHLDAPHLEVALGNDEAFIAASLIKIPLMTAAFMAVSENKISLEDICTLTAEDVAGGSGVLKARPLPCEVSVAELIELMIADSDNTASNKVISLLGVDYIKEKFKELNLTETKFSRRIADFDARKRGKENFISCRDMARIFEALYRRELISREYSDTMLSYLLKQKINDRIPKYLPSHAAVAHKTGLERNSVGDAGIVYAPCGDYFLCVITSDFKDYTTAKEFIAKVSSVVYNTSNASACFRDQ